MKIKVRQDPYLSTSRRGAREIRPRHSLSRAPHRTAPYIYTEHTSTHLHPSRTAFLPNLSLLLPYSPRYLSISLAPSLFPRFTGLSLFLSVAFPRRIPFTPSSCLPIPLYLSLSLSLFPTISLSIYLSLSLSPTGRKPRRPPFSPVPFLLLVRMVNR